MCKLCAQGRQSNTFDDSHICFYKPIRLASVAPTTLTSSLLLGWKVHHAMRQLIAKTKDLSTLGYNFTERPGRTLVGGRSYC
ncbi:MAG: hypothetical protein ACYSWW_23875 [Planctomycetota bacterium]